MERWLLDLPGIIVAHADSRRRVLIGWPTASRDGELIAGGDAGMWVDAEAVEHRDHDKTPGYDARHRRGGTYRFFRKRSGP